MIWSLSIMKHHKLIFLAAVLASAPLAGLPSARASTDAPPQPQIAVPDTAPRLSPPVRDVVKMVTAGVPGDVVTAYIQTSSSTFNLTPDAIVYLQGVGVSGGITSTMLAHDKMLHDNVSAVPPQPIYPTPTGVQPPMPETIAPNAETGADTAPPVSDTTLYNNLAPYGSWSDLPGYGWGWQPYGWLGYNAYPWGFLGFGSWCNFPGRGWCWFPRSHFRDFDRFHGGNFHEGNHFQGDRFHDGRGAFAGNRFEGNHFGGGQFHSRTFGQPLGFHGALGGGINHGAFGSRGFNGGVSVRTIGGNGFHGGGAGFHSGGGGFR